MNSHCAEELRQPQPGKMRIGPHSTLRDWKFNLAEVMRDPFKRARAYASTSASGHTCTRDFNMCWGCWTVPALHGVFCPSCEEEHKQNEIRNVEIEFARKEEIKRKAYTRRRENGYYN